MAKRRVFVAGHRGLIGSAFVRRLESAGEVEVVTRTRDEVDLRDPSGVRALFADARFDAVVLAAGRVGGIVENVTNPASFLEDNLAIQSNVLGEARRNGVRRVLFFASSCMYPRGLDRAMAEADLLTASPEPTSLPYAVAKLAGLQLCLAYNRQDGGSRFVPLIPNSVYGSNDNFDPQRGHVLSSLITRMHEAKVAGAASVTLWGTGTPRREFLFSDDLAACGATLLDANLDDVALPLNVGTGSDIAIRELAELIARVVGYEGRLEWDTSRPDGAPRKLLDSTRVHALGWTPKVQLEQGIEATYRWYLERAASRMEAKS
jgi:GDP-L-fucose synthase